MRHVSDVVRFEIASFPAEPSVKMLSTFRTKHMISAFGPEFYSTCLIEPGQKKKELIAVKAKNKASITIIYIKSGGALSRVKSENSDILTACAVARGG